MRTLVFLIIFFISCTQSVNFNSAAYNARYDDIDNSSIIIKDNSNQYYLHRCLVRKINDTVFIAFRDTSKLSNWYELDIAKVKNKLVSNCRNTFMITDSSYKIPILTTYNQLIKLNKSEYHIGDSIYGNISLDISCYNQWPTIYTDTIKVVGSFHAIVQ